LTGRRLVGLPFSDHCDPIGSDAEVARLLQYLPRSLAEEKLKYIEIRPLRNVNPAGFNEAEAFHLHMLDLDPDLYDIFQAFHKSSIQRTIRRSERLGVQLSQGSSEWHLETFYGLFVLTRKRLQVPPQPIEWFRNLVSCLGSKLNISIALHENRPIASIITLRHRDVVTYKYGGSDARFHHLGGVSCLFWNVIRHAKLSGAKNFDFGRSDIENVGLATFKSRWGATSSKLAYWRCGRVQQHKWESQPMINAVKLGLGKLPATALIGVGRLLYRHIG
jgi:lipid II:glycine glycyltransferase (peptidoglycan interpeptide bridge formation enzyme)